eukprot:3706732-Alexandrium_andersonii.AAC.1
MAVAPCSNRHCRHSHCAWLLVSSSLMVQLLAPMLLWQWLQHLSPLFCATVAVARDGGVLVHVDVSGSADVGDVVD